MVGNAWRQREGGRCEVVSGSISGAHVLAELRGAKKAEARGRGCHFLRRAVERGRGWGGRQGGSEPREVARPVSPH